jgi:AcrR family transcriptional regulator
MPAARARIGRHRAGRRGARGAAVTRRGRPPRSDRERLLDAAERAIRRAGAQVSLGQIARTARVTKPALFAHVGDRRALVRGLAAQLAELLWRVLAPPVRASDART